MLAESEKSERLMFEKGAETYSFYKSLNPTRVNTLLRPLSNHFTGLSDLKPKGQPLVGILLRTKKVLTQISNRKAFQFRGMISSFKNGLCQMLESSTLHRYTATYPIAEQSKRTILLSEERKSD